jgi:hypothetical protein
MCRVSRVHSKDLLINSWKAAHPLTSNADIDMHKLFETIKTDREYRYMYSPVDLEGFFGVSYNTVHEHENSILIRRCCR